MKLTSFARGPGTSFDPTQSCCVVLEISPREPDINLLGCSAEQLQRRIRKLPKSELQ